MKKHTTHKLALRPETLRSLTSLRLTEARGGDGVGTRDPAGGCPLVAAAGTQDPAGGCPLV